MEYITVGEAAEKWGISSRLVQKYCAEGRIEGVVKFGKSWGIPSNAQKPQDPRSIKQQSQEQSTFIGAGLMPLMNSAFVPGNCMSCIESMTNNLQRKVAMAEYYYFSGQPEKAVHETETLLEQEDLGVRLSAYLIYAYANLSIGQSRSTRYALSELQRYLQKAAYAVPELRAAETFVAFAAAVLLHLPLPQELPPTQEFLPLLPPGLRAFALYVQAHLLYLQGEYAKSAGMAEATLSMGAENYPIPAIYLHLVAVMNYMSLRQPEQAKTHLLAAWTLARPDDLIEGLGEHHGLLGGMLEAVIKPQWPKDFKRIIAITYRFSAGWRKIHNPETGHFVADDLTTTEFVTAMLAARGWTNQEISVHLNISPHTVKQHISVALQKLHIKHRQELKKYMLL